MAGAAAVDARLKTGVDHPVHLLRAQNRDAVDAVAREAISAHLADPVQALDAGASKADACARLGATKAIPDGAVQVLAGLAVIERALLGIVIPIAGIVERDDLAG